MYIRRIFHNPKFASFAHNSKNTKQNHSYIHIMYIVLISLQIFQQSEPNTKSGYAGYFAQWLR